MVSFLAFRNVYQLRRRYAMIFVAVAIGFALINCITGMAYGAMSVLESKAARYFAGHVSVTGFVDGEYGLRSPGKLMEILRDSDLPIRTVAPRTVYYNLNATLSFGGETVRQRRLVGLDFETEREELEGLNFSSGGLERMSGTSASMGILISEAAASLTGARLGDELTLFLTTDSGQFNTANLTIQGIFEETSLFGYVAYMRYEDLNVLMGRSMESATDIAIYLKPSQNLVAMTERIRTFLGESRQVLPRLQTKEELSLALKKDSSGERLAVLSLDAHLVQIRNLLNAFMIITYAVSAVFIAIVMVGVLNTYRILVYERTREIGTMRALGMPRETVVALFAIEAVILGSAASLLGGVISVGVMQILKIADLSSFSAAGLFTVKGHMQSVIRPDLTLAYGIGMVVAVVLAAWGPAFKAGKVPPVEALRSNG